MRPSLTKNAFVYLLILVASIALFYSFLSPSDSVGEIPLSKVAEYLKKGQVKSLELTSDGLIRLTNNDGSRYTSRKEPNVGLGETLISLGVEPLLVWWLW